MNRYGQKNNKRMMAVTPGLFEKFDETNVEADTWKKDSENPVLGKEKQWEAMGINPGSIFYNHREKLYMMWYTTYDFRGRYPTGLAVSQDGIGWQRHKSMVDPVPFKHQCIFPVINEGDGYGECPYCALALFRENRAQPLRMCFLESQDGMQWKWKDKKSYWEGPSDVLNLMWDSKRECFVSYHKLWKVCGKTLNGEIFEGIYHSFEPCDMKDGTMKITGHQMNNEDPSGQDTVRLVYKSMGCDDGGGGTISDELSMKRIIARAESRDFVNWSRQKVILEPETWMGNSGQFYGMPVFQYENIYFGLLRYFDGISGKISGLITVSEDGEKFEIASSTPVMDTGEKGEWEGGMVLPCAQPVIKRNSIYVYYGGYKFDHTQPDKNQSVCGGRCIVKKDRFAYINGGRARTRKLGVHGSTVHINAKGHVGIKMLDVQNNTIGSGSFDGDSLDYKLLKLENDLAYENIVLEFDVSKGKLYSFWFV